MKESRHRWHLPGLSGLVLLFSLSHLAYHLPSGIFQPLLPSIRDEFGLDYTRAGFLMASRTFVTGLATLVGGWVADRVGRRLLLTIGICGVALAAILLGFSQTYFMLVALLILEGLLGGGYHAAAAPLVAQSVDWKERGSALGLHMIGGGGSQFLAPLIAVGLAALWGWRSPCILTGIPRFIFGIIFYRILGQRLKDKKKTEYVTSKTEDSETSSQSDLSSHRFRRGRLIAFLSLSILCGALIHTPMSFLPLFLTDHFGTSQEMVGVFYSIVSVGGILAGPLGGYLSDRFGPVAVTVAMFLISSPLIFLLNMVPFGVFLAALLIILNMVASIRMVMAQIFVINQTAERHQSTLVGILFFGSSEIGTVLTPAMGKLIDLLGFSASFSIVAGATLMVTLICWILLRRNRD